MCEVCRQNQPQGTLPVHKKAIKLLLGLLVLPMRFKHQFSLICSEIYSMLYNYYLATLLTQRNIPQALIKLIETASGPQVLWVFFHSCYLGHQAMSLRDALSVLCDGKNFRTTIETQ